MDDGERLQRKADARCEQWRAMLDAFQASGGSDGDIEGAATCMVAAAIHMRSYAPPGTLMEPDDAAWLRSIAEIVDHVASALEN